MALDLTAIRQALAAAVNTVAGLRAYDHLPDTFASSSGGTTAVLIGPGVGDDYVDYFESFGQGGAAGPLCTVAMRLTVVVPNVDARAAQARLDAVLSAGTGRALSLIDALLADLTLGGVVSSCLPRAARAPYQLVVGDDGATRYLASDVELTIWARRA